MTVRKSKEEDNTNRKQLTHHKKEEESKELITANRKIAFQQTQKEKRADELIIANKELAFQNQEKENRAAELIIANIELAFQNEEKEKRAAELVIANKELRFQNLEKEKKATELLATLERVSFLASIADNIQDPVVSTDTLGNITRWNKAAEKLFEWTSDEALGKNSGQLLKADYLNTERQEISEAIKNIHFWHGEGLYFSKSGRQVNVLVTVSDLKNAEGLINGNLALIRDITKRKTAEDEIIKANKRFSTIFNFSPVAIAITNLQEGKFIYVNDSFCQTTGYKRENILGKRTVDIKIIGTEAREKLIEGILNKRGVGKDIEETLQTANGNSIHVLCTAEKMEIDNQACLAFVLVDITERKKSEERIKQMNVDLEKQTKELSELNKELTFKYEERLKEVSDYKYSLDESSILAITDQKGTIKYVNDNFCKISKYSKEELVGQDHRIVNSGCHSQEFIKSIWTTIANGKVWKGEIKNKAKDGTAYWVDTTIVPFLDEHKKPFQYVAIRSDITERKRAEEQVIKSYRDKEVVLNRISDGVVSVDNNWRYTFLNEASLLTHPFSKEETLGKVIWEVHPEMKGTIFWDKYHEAMQTRKVVEIESFYAPMHIWFSVKVYPSSDGLTIFYKDVTEQKGTEKTILELNEGLETKIKERTEQLESANKEMESFSYSVAHDLRSPVRAMHGYATMLVEDYHEKLDEEGRRLLSEISYNAKNMGTLIDDLLTFSRLGRKEISKSHINMNELTRDVWTELKALSKKESVVLIHTLDPIHADAALMKHVMSNLLSNALKYSSKKEKPLIEISSRLESGAVIYSVKDNGVGFNMAYSDKLFGVFQRLHSEEEFEGTGVGLAIVQRIILRHKGKIWAEAEEDKGATFYFSLPADEETAKEVHLN